MRDGKVVAADRADAFDRDKLVADDGQPSAANARGRRRASAARGSTRGPRPRPARAPDATAPSSSPMRARSSALPASPGHGQTQLLLRIFEARPGALPGIEVAAPVALVAGDRQSDGIFPLWSIAENIGIRSIAALRKGLLISGERETELAEGWQKRIKIRTPDVHNNILSLSGGNQQKALFARALGSDARIVLMDDPDARRRYRHQARGLRPDPRGGARRAAPSSGTRPRWKSSRTATTSMSSATAASSPTSAAAS